MKFKKGDLVISQKHGIKGYVHHLWHERRWYWLKQSTNDKSIAWFDEGDLVLIPHDDVMQDYVEAIK